MDYVVGIDIGGTFTDCVVVDQAGNLTLGKAFSTPPNFDNGIIDALTVVAQDLKIPVRSLLENTRLFLHSTTVAENAIVDGNMAKAGVITTVGHEDTLFAMRGGYGRWSGLTEDEKRNPIDTDKPSAVVPRALIRGIKERADAHGQILREADEADIEAQLKSLLDSGIDALGVSLLWSFVNPSNEQKIRRVVERLRPDLFLSLSHEIAPIIGEYERTSSVALNARLGPVVQKYLDTLRTRLVAMGFDGILLVAQAYGGLLPFDQAKARPIGMIESGPVSGLVGSNHQGNLIGARNIIATDMGGTTFKVGMVREGLIEYQREPMVFRYHYALPKMDVVSLGLAGGSIISIDPRTGMPQIGPKSAGSYPGPVCYDHGGEDPTVTDVDAILGFMNPTFFAGGRAGLDIEKAKRVFKEKVADPLGMELIPAAAAIYKLANSMIYDLLHKATVQRGLDPRQFALFSFGGTAGMHVAAYGEELGADPIVVPYAASVQGAYGLVISDVVHEEQISQPMAMPADLDRVNGLFADLRDKVVNQLRNEGFTDDQITVQCSIDMSYRRQVHIVTVPVEGGLPISEAELDQTVSRFEDLYREKYGKESGYREAGIELAVFRVRGAGAVQKPIFQVQPEDGPDASHAILEHRQAWVQQLGEMRTVAGYSFDKLRHGNEVPGPAIIWTPVTTVVVAADQVARVDSYHNLILSRRPR